MRPSPLAASLLLASVALFPIQTQAQRASKTADSTTAHPRAARASEDDHATTGTPGGRSSSAGVATLPVTRVALYKNGVGFFEHTGHVSGDAAVTIDLTSSQLNDVLQSLTAIDLNGGRISGAGYNSTTPLEQQLKTLPLSLDDNPTASDFYSAIRGARVEVHSGPVGITGRLLSVEARTVHPTDNSTATIDRYYITVVSDTGDTRTVELTAATSVRLLEPSLNNDVTRYLQLIDANRSQGLRHLILSDNGTGTRELRVSYISEVPIWKSTYRILFTNTPASTNTAGAPRPEGTSVGGITATLQGWSVVDNTTGADWNNVQLSLIAGAPQSFIQPLSQPIYSRRPEIPIAQEAQLTPQTHDSSIDAYSGSGISGSVVDATGAVIPNASVSITAENGQQQSATTDSQGHFAFSAPPGRYRIQVSSPGFQTFLQNGLSTGTGPMNITLPIGASNEMVEVQGAPNEVFKSMRIARGAPGGVLGGMPIGGPIANYQDLAQASVTPNAQSSSFDDFFEYRITQPVTIRKNESALVPILQVKLPADPVTLVSYANGRTSQPLRALWITNTSGLTLDRGSFSIVEDGNFGGEGLLDSIHPDEKRLLSYAADQAVHATVEDDKSSNHVTLIRGTHGVVDIHRAELHELTLVLHNAASSPRTIVSEVPIINGWKLDSLERPASTDPKPVETTATVYRYRTVVAPGDTARLHIAATHSGYSTYRLEQSDDNQINFLLATTDRNPALVAALQPILDARAKVADAQNAVDQTKARIDSLTADEQRQRDNITALKDADKSSRDRFVSELNKTEDALTAAQAELATRTSALDAAKAALATAIDNFSIDQTI